MDNRIFIRLDADNIGDNIELNLLNSDYKKAQDIHNKIQTSMNHILEYIGTLESVIILMRGCDDILFSIEHSNYSLSILENIKSSFLNLSGFTLSIGAGKSLNESILNLRLAKLSGKNKIITSITAKEKNKNMQI